MEVISLFGSIFLRPAKAILIAAVVFIPFERLGALHPKQRILRKGFATDVLTGLMNGFLLYAALLISLGKVDAVAAAWIPNLRLWMTAQPLWAQAMVAVVLGDLGIYGSHRLVHTLPWLWRFHAIHHSAEELDWLVGFRFHPVDLFLLDVASLGPLIALNLSPVAIGIFISVYGWQSSLVHANLRFRYGPFRWLLVSPEFHHWHHSAERAARDRNYASVLSFWDVLFGTVYLPRGIQPSGYGVDERVPAGWKDRLIYPLKRQRMPQA